MKLRIACPNHPNPDRAEPGAEHLVVEVECGRMPAQRLVDLLAAFETCCDCDAPMVILPQTKVEEAP